jgi:hypothetical protein
MLDDKTALNSSKSIDPDASLVISSCGTGSRGLSEHVLVKYLESELIIGVRLYRQSVHHGIGVVSVPA